MNQAKIIFRNIYCTPVSKEHINKGWLSWMNNPITAKQINKKGKKYTEHDLENYLKEKKSIFFLACYTNENEYFGNLRIHEWTSNIACFGRLIGSDKHRGKGYGKLILIKGINKINKIYMRPKIIAITKKNNIVSQKCLISANFKLKSAKKNKLKYYFKNIK